MKFKPGTEYNFHGNYTEYYRNGNKKLSCRFVQGVLSGEYIEYYKNGKVKFKCYVLRPAELPLACKIKKYNV